MPGSKRAYAAGRTDEIVEPFVVFDYPGVSPVDVALHFNCVGDGARQLSLALAAPAFDAFPRKNGRAPFGGRFARLVPFDSPVALPTIFSKPAQSLAREASSQA